jgi:hypothetical protein
MNLKTPIKVALFIAENGHRCRIPLFSSKDWGIKSGVKMLDSLKEELPHLYVVELIENIWSQRNSLVGVGRYLKPMKFVKFTTMTPKPIFDEESDDEDSADWWRK